MAVFNEEKVTGLGFKLQLDDFCIDLCSDRINVKQSVDNRNYYFKEYEADANYSFIQTENRIIHNPKKMNRFIFFDGKSRTIPLKKGNWFPDFANYRRNGYDFDARFDDGLASYKDKELFELLDLSAPILSKELKEKGNYRKDGKKGFDTIMNRLQTQCYVIISNFVYQKDKHGKPYGWGIAEYSTPEKFMGNAFTDKVYEHTPEESYQRILTHLKKLLPDTDEAAIRKILK